MSFQGRKPPVALPTSHLKPKVAGNKPSQKYEEAVKVLSPETMTEALELLLSERDYQEAPQKPSDAEKLQKLYEKCEAATQIIEKEAPRIAVPKAPIQRAAMQIRTQAQPIQPKITAMQIRTQAQPMYKPIKPRITKSTLPNRGMVTGLLPNKLKRTPMQRHESESSLSDHSDHKKPRVNEGSSQPPPPSARNFLAKLNKETPASKRPQRGRNSPTEEEEAEIDESSSTGEEIEEEEEDEESEEEKEPETKNEGAAESRSRRRTPGRQAKEASPEKKKASRSSRRK